MKEGCYIATDSRNVERPASPVVKLLRMYSTGDVIIGALVINTTGAGSFPLPFPDGDPEFVDDEAAGLLVVPTADGPVTFRWPSKEDFDALAPGAPVSEWPDTLASDEERQAFLASLCGEAI